jgi:hypothetical protein
VNALYCEELQVLIVEALKCEQLLQKGDQPARVVAIWFRKVNVLQEEYKPVAFSWTKHSTCVCREEATALPEFLNDMLSGCLCIAMQSRDTSCLLRTNEVLDQGALSAS